MSAVAIHFENVTMSFGARPAVNNLNLSIPQGSVTAFLGPNGAGKTTAIKLLLGLHHQTLGSITVLGEDSRRLSAAAWLRQHWGTFIWDATAEKYRLPQKPKF